LTGACCGTWLSSLVEENTPQVGQVVRLVHKRIAGQVVLGYKGIGRQDVVVQGLGR